jgi:hypothetical protein
MLVIEEAQDLQPRDVTPRPSVIERLNLESSVVEISDEPDHEAILNAAAKQGLDALKEAWQATPREIQNRLGKDYLDALKDVASSLVIEPELTDDPEEDPEAMF